MPRLNPRVCARCGKKLMYPDWVRSNWNENYYCANLDPCKERAAKLNKLARHLLDPSATGGDS